MCAQTIESTAWTEVGHRCMYSTYNYNDDLMIQPLIEKFKVMKIGVLNRKTKSINSYSTSNHN